MKKTCKHLLWAYYGMLFLMVVVLTVCVYFLKKGHMPSVEQQSSAGQIIQYIMIGYMLLSVAGGLYIFNLACKRWAKMDDDLERLRRYEKYGIIRIVVIGLGIPLGIFAFYYLQGFQSMLWCAAISAIGLIFCKPNERKIELDLFNPDAL